MCARGAPEALPVDMLEAGRESSLVPIRCRGSLHFYSVRNPTTGRPQVLVMAPRLPLAEGRALLRNLARVHHLVAGGAIPDVAALELDGPTPWVALDCEAVADLENILDFVLQGGDKPTLHRTSAITKVVLETLVRVHQVRDPETGRQVCLGSLAHANLLFAADGKMSIVGFGAGPLAGAFVAPEVAAGRPPTPGSDVYALTVFMRSHAGFAGLPAAIRRVLGGRSLATDAKLVVLFVWSNLRILAAPPARRPDTKTALAQAQKLWRLLGFEPDVDGWADFVAQALRSEPERLPDASTPRAAPRILVGRDAEWLETPNGMRHALGARRPLRRLLLALAEARRDRAGAPVTVDEMLQIGWPGESPLPEAGRNRVYVAVSTLRKLGLGESLQRWDAGYRLDPGVPCQLNGA
jgi:hypothetical protein